jgi:hypothetical protein
VPSLFPAALDNFATDHSTASPTRYMGPDVDDHGDALNALERQLVRGVVGSLWSNVDQAAIAPATQANNASNGSRWVQVKVTAPCTVSGVRYRKGTGTSTANVIVALYAADGQTRLAVSSSTAQGTTASAHLSIAFTAAVNLEAGFYWVYWMGSTTSADFMGWATGAGGYLGPAGNANQGSFAAPATITPPTFNPTNPAANVPLLMLY